MSALGASASLSPVLLVRWDAFEAVLLPRRVTRQPRLDRLYYAHAWKPWAGTARRMRPGRWRNSFLAAFGPLSVIILIGLWAVGFSAASDMESEADQAVEGGENVVALAGGPELGSKSGPIRVMAGSSTSRAGPGVRSVVGWVASLV